MSFKDTRGDAFLVLACCALFLGACVAYEANVPLTGRSSTAPDLTEEQQIVARFVEALGGEDALRAHSSATTKGTFELPAMGSGPMTVYQMAPDKTLATISVPGMGEIVQGYNGEIGWAEDLMQGARLVEGEMLAQAKRDARFYAELEYDDLYPQQTAAGETEWNGQAVYQLDLVDSGGNESSQYFAKDTGLLIGAEATITNEMGTSQVTFDFGEYRVFGGVRIPTSTTMTMMGMEIVQTVESITWDDVEASVFEPSDAVKALLVE